VLSCVQHPSIISFYAARTVPPDICIVEELAVGGSLHDKLHGKPGERRRIPLPYDQVSCRLVCDGVVGIVVGYLSLTAVLHLSDPAVDQDCHRRGGRHALLAQRAQSQDSAP
jgi:hypothetical protein